MKIYGNLKNILQ